MALIDYSDSEESDNETTKAVISRTSTKKLDRTDSKKIKVDLPALKSDAEQSEPAQKRQRTNGAFSGFNSLLPAPKRVATSSIKPGVSLRTSSEAAFSRAPVAAVPTRDVVTTTSEDVPAMKESIPEPKLMGKPTRFMPLSVANAKKKKKRPVADEVGVVATHPSADQEMRDPESSSEPSQPKPKKSLFSVTQVESEPLNASQQVYEPEFIQSKETPELEQPHIDNTLQETALDGAASDLNLSASDRRRMFGRNGNKTDVKITHFDMNAEYQSNQELAANGQVVEHREVRAIAPGRHSLQQLVNNVRGQKDAIEDKWAEGRRNRGEAGSKYGW